MAEEAACYKTHDYVLAAALYAAGVKMKGVEREAPSDRFRHGRAVFIFTDAADAENKVSQYYGGLLFVEARTFQATMNEYRKLVFAKENLGGSK